MAWNTVAVTAALLVACGKSEDKLEPAKARPQVDNVAELPTARLSVTLNRGTASIELPEGEVTNDKKREGQTWKFDNKDGSSGMIQLESRTDGLRDLGPIAGQRVQRYLTQMGNPEPPVATRQLPDGAMVTFANADTETVRSFVVRMRPGWTVECRAYVLKGTSTGFAAMKAWGERTCLSMTIDTVN